MKLTNAALLFALAGGTFASCASHPNKVEIAATADPTQEISALEQDLQLAEKNQIPVLAPYNYEKSVDMLKDAKKLREKNDSNQAILDKVGYSRAYLNLGNESVARAEKSIPAIVEARKDALNAGAATVLKKELSKADDDLKGYTKSADKKNSDIKIDSDDRDKIHKAYLDVELKTIKTTYLGKAKATLEAAKEQKAEKYSPKTYKETVDKITSAERIIETDRHSLATITAASNEATAAADKLMNVNNIARDSKKQTPEEIALRMNAQNNALAKTATSLEETEQALQSTNHKLLDKNHQLAVALTKERKSAEFDRVFADARKAFKPHEADVLRDGDKLIIRLKALQFKSGEANLSAPSFALLNRVKEVVAHSNTRDVIIEGHTDGTGSKDVNQKISEKRAETVSSYLINEGVIEKDQVKTEGFGFDRPIATNKTKEGRAENRRVDVIITPEALTEVR